MIDGLAADEDGQCRNAQGGGEEEVVLGGSARRCNNLNIHEEEANHECGAQGNIDPDEERMLRLMCALRIKVAIPVFKGDKNEDPIEFKTKALDYMEATDIFPSRNVLLSSVIALRAKRECGMMKLPYPIHGMN